MFQKTVNRQYTTGFPGDIVRDGPKRAKPARIDSTGAAPNPNRVSRAFGWSGDQPPLGGPDGTVDYQSLDGLVVVGGTNFFGILGHPKHYVLNGNATDGTLGASLDLPRGAEGEFFDMVTGMVVELFNETTGVKAVVAGDLVAYMAVTASGAENPQGLPAGALFSLSPGEAVPAGAVLIPGARIQQSVSMAASAVGALVVTPVIVQLTQ